MATQNEAHLRRMLDEANDLAGRKSRNASEDARLHELVELIKSQREFVKTERALRAEAGATSSQRGSKAGTSVGSDVYGAMIRAGWNAKSVREVLVPSDALLGQAKADVISAIGDMNPSQDTGRVVPLGIDSRFLWSNIGREQLPFEGVPSVVEYLRESAVTRPTAGTTELDLDHATNKPATGVTAVLASSAVKVFGTISESQPNALLGQAALRQIVQRELVHTLHRDLERHLLAVIDADANINTLAQGTVTVPDALFMAGNDLRDDGFEPSVVVMSTTDAESVDLMKDAQDHYLREPGSPLFGMRRVTSSIVAAGTAYVVDPSVLRLHVSPLFVGVDPYSEWAANRSTLKAEFYGVGVVSQGTGICKVTLN